jgi:8-oxo-dGTP diphosphatase
VMADDGRILMLRHVFHPVAPWGLPGGWLERHESPATAALRELYEETGLSATLGPIIHLSHEAIPAHIGIAYLAYAQPAPLRLSAEILEAAWFEPEDLPSPLLPFVRQAIQTAVKHYRNGANLAALSPG